MSYDHCSIYAICAIMSGRNTYQLVEIIFPCGDPYGDLHREKSHFHKFPLVKLLPNCHILAITHAQLIKAT